jgi:hypothetical protein
MSDSRTDSSEKKKKVNENLPGAKIAMLHAKFEHIIYTLSTYS